jgi:hypothetical protein
VGEKTELIATKYAQQHMMTVTLTMADMNNSAKMTKTR